MFRSISGALLLVLLTGCGGTDPSPPAETATAPSAGVATVGQPPGVAACALLKTAIDEGTLMQPGVADAVVAASVTTNQPVAAAGQRLGAAYAAAVASHDTDGEPDAVAAVSAAGADMKSVCVDEGLETAG
jgi:hypothetical protein